MLECIECPYYDYGLSGQYCDKVGGKTLLYGYCTYVYEKNATHKNNSKQKRRNKRERDQKHKNHLKFLAENVTGIHLQLHILTKFGLEDKDIPKTQNHIIKEYIVEEGGVVIPIIIKKCLIERFEDTLENYQRREI